MSAHDVYYPDLPGTDAVERFTVAWRTSDPPPDLVAFLPDADVVRLCTLIDLIKVDMAQRQLHAAPRKVLADYVAQFPELQHQSNGLVELFDADSGDSTRIARVATYEPLEDLEVGQQIDDFDLVTGLGSGAFARVFLARQRSMQRLVAVKISEDHGTEPQTLAQLDHDYIVRVFDQRVLPERELRLLYMQYLPGGTLLDVLARVRKITWSPERNGRLLLDAVDDSMEAKGEIRPTDSSVRGEIAELSWPETIAWLGRRLADALDYAGKRGVLHRDIKPANILLTAEGIPKLADFNISFSGRIAGDSPVAYFGGSLSYMSPEQLEACHPGRPGTAGDLDSRSDIYSLGVVLWELLTGRKPFADKSIEAGDRTTLDAMLERRRHGVTPDTLESMPPDTPAALQRVLLTCLHPDKNHRWATGGELAQQLDLCLDPHARDLVDPPPDSWRLRLRRWQIPIVALAIGIPNALASLYNIEQNQMLVFSKLSAAVQERIQLQALIANVIGFSAGAILIVYLCRRLLTVPRGLRSGREFSTDILAKTRSDALLMGDRIVAVCFVLWVASGVSWQLGLRFADHKVSFETYVHLSAAQVVCAAIAVAYPFFLVTFYSVRSLYPAFLPYGETSEDDAAQLRGLRVRCNFYLAVAASVPLLGVAGVTFLQADEISSVILAVRVLCIGGAIGFVWSYRLFRLIEADLSALERVVSRGP